MPRYIPSKKSALSKRPTPCLDTAPCPCESPSPKAHSSLTERKALAVEPDLKAANITRLKRTEGQVRGIIKMIEADRYCPDVMIQISAAQESLRAVSKNLLKNHLKHCARAALKAGEEEADAMCDELMDVMTKLAK